MTTTICPCGIHRDDCDYHKPEPVTLRAAPDSESPTVRFGTWSSSVVIDIQEFANDPLTKIAHQIGLHLAQRRQEILLDAMKAYFA